MAKKSSGNWLIPPKTLLWQKIENSKAVRTKEIWQNYDHQDKSSFWFRLRVCQARVFVWSHFPVLMERLLQARLAAEFGKMWSYLSNWKVITELGLSQRRERKMKFFELWRGQLRCQFGTELLGTQAEAEKKGNLCLSLGAETEHILLDLREKTGTGCAAGARLHLCRRSSCTSADSAGPGAFMKELHTASMCSSCWEKPAKISQTSAEIDRQNYRGQRNVCVLESRYLLPVQACPWAPVLKHSDNILWIMIINFACGSSYLELLSMN